MLTLFEVVAFIVCVAFIFNEGLWGAGLQFCNVLMAAVLATNIFEAVANWMDSMWPSLTYLSDFIAIWVSFAIIYTIMRLFTDRLSRHRVKFKKIVDVSGGVAFAVGVGCIMLQFIMFTMHLAPLERNYLGFQEKPDSSTFLFGLSPDRNWMSFMYNLSKNGSLSRSSATDPNAHVFDPNGDFVLKYAQRRKNFESSTSITVGQ
jgi:hypothetical protein